GCGAAAFFFSSRRRHTRFSRDWSSDVCSSDLVRYFLWQFVGRASDVQGAPPATGFAFVDDRIGSNEYFHQTPSEKASRNEYFALPLLLGLMGAGYHFHRDWKRAFSVGRKRVV